MENTKKLTEQLIKTTNEVRQKCRKLKRSKIEDNIFLDESFKPITKPLKQLIEQFPKMGNNNVIPAKVTKLENSNPSTSSSPPQHHSSSSSSSSQSSSSSSDDEQTDNNSIQTYLTLVKNKSSLIDSNYGVCLVKNQADDADVYKIGNSTLIASKFLIYIDNVEYMATPG